MCDWDRISVLSICFKSKLDKFQVPGILYRCYTTCVTLLPYFATHQNVQSRHLRSMKSLLNGNHLFVAVRVSNELPFSLGCLHLISNIVEEGSVAERLRRWTLVLRVPGSRPTRFGWLFVPMNKALYSNCSVVRRSRNTLIVPWFGGHVKPSVPSEVLSTLFRM